MYVAHWQLLFVAGIITSATAIRGPDIVLTVYASLANLGVWSVLAFGAVATVAADGTQHTSLAVAFICLAHGILSSLVSLYVGLAEWWASDDQEDDRELGPDDVEQLLGDEFS